MTPAIARIYFAIFGSVTIAGGVLGYVTKHSLLSIVAGSIAGLLLIVGSLLLGRMNTQTVGTAVSLLVSLALAARFGAALFHGLLNPGVYMAPLAVAGVCVAALLLFRPES